MTEEIIRKLLDSTNYQDILIAMEFIAKNFSRTWFEENILSRSSPHALLKVDTECKPPNDYVFVWEGYHYVWDYDELWAADDDPKCILAEDIIIYL